MYEIYKVQTGDTLDSIANKYPNDAENISKLADKIIKGGTGVWGNTAMTPHPALPKADAETMLKYIFSLKTS